MSFDTIDLMTGNIFQVTWDTGRRCNYDCSYCPAHRHDNFSPHPSLDELINSTDFLFEYIDTYMKYRHLLKEASISFTGGEPTVNPNFIPFVKYLRKKYETEYRDKWNCGFALTSNGAFSQKMADNIIEHMDHITISYHTEADEKLKHSIIDRILYIDKNSKSRSPDDPLQCTVSVNVMFHAQYFDECKEVCNILHENDVKYVPRIIGEEPGSRSNFAHTYSDEQLDYMKNYWKYRNAQLNNEKETASRLSATGEPKNEADKAEKTAKKTAGWAIGRPCCGGREMCLSAKGEERKGTFVDFRNFKGWYCSVNWFFLHLEQQTDSVFHHQTCQAQFGQTRGPIGKISEGKKLVEDLRQKMENGTMPTIICPKHTCGCGLCAPKSAYLEKYQEVLKKHVDSSVFENATVDEPKQPPIIPTEMID